MFNDDCSSTKLLDDIRKFFLIQRLTCNDRYFTLFQISLFLDCFYDINRKNCFTRSFSSDYQKVSCLGSTLSLARLSLSRTSTICSLIPLTGTKYENNFFCSSVSPAFNPISLVALRSYLPVTTNPVSNGTPPFDFLILAWISSSDGSSISNSSVSSSSSISSSSNLLPQSRLRQSRLRQSLLHQDPLPQSQLRQNLSLQGLRQNQALRHRRSLLRRNPLRQDLLQSRLRQNRFLHHLCLQSRLRHRLRQNRPLQVLPRQDLLPQNQLRQSLPRRNLLPQVAFVKVFSFKIFFLKSPSSKSSPSRSSSSSRLRQNHLPRNCFHSYPVRQAHLRFLL